MLSRRPWLSFLAGPAQGNGVLRSIPTEPKAAGPQKIYDGIYPYWGNFDREADAFCQLRLFARDGKEPMVVLTELPANPSTSVTNMIEILTAEVITRYQPHRLEVIGEIPKNTVPRVG
jgi:hypothetical protein